MPDPAELRIRVPAFTAEDHSIASASPLDACLLGLRSTEYVLPFCPLPAEAKLESLWMKMLASSQTSVPCAMNVKLYATVCVSRAP